MICPHCGNKLEVMMVEDVTHIELRNINTHRVMLEVLFHCEKCTYDWQALTEIPNDTKLYPKLWG